MMKTITTIALLMFSIVFLGCLESNPQPSPNKNGDGEAVVDDQETNGASPGDPRDVDEDRILLSAVSTDGTAAIYGMDGAAEGAMAGAVYASDDQTAELAEFQVSDAGGFAVVVGGLADSVDVLIVFEFAEAKGYEPVPLTLQLPDSALDPTTPWMADSNDEDGFAGSDPQEGGWQLNGAAAPGIRVEADDAGMLTVTGDPLAATPLSLVVVINLTQGDFGSVQSSSQGAFQVQLGGASGDDLMLYSVNPLDRAKATPPVELTVP